MYEKNQNLQRNNRIVGSPSQPFDLIIINLKLSYFKTNSSKDQRKKLQPTNNSISDLVNLWRLEEEMLLVLALGIQMCHIVLPYGFGNSSCTLRVRLDTNLNHILL